MTIINRDREKQINLIIYFVQNTKKCFKTKLFKLLFFADFLHFKQTGKSITGFSYAAWEHGPVPYDLYQELKTPKEDLKSAITIIDVPGNNFYKFVAKSKFDDRYFTRRELQIMSQVAAIFKEADAELMVESSHLKNEPWHRTISTKGRGVVVEYTLALDNSTGAISIEDYQELQQELEAFQRTFA